MVAAPTRVAPVRGRRPTVRHAVSTLAAAVAVLSTTACGPTSNQEGGMPQRGSSAPAPDQTTIADALSFSGIVLPASATVVGAQHDRGIDERYRLAIRLNPADIDPLLTGSGFTTALLPDPGPYQQPVDGYTLDGATNVTSAEDNLPAGGDRKRSVFRHVALDRSDPDNPVMYWWIFTT